jgi:hypothetical protein
MESTMPLYEISDATIGRLNRHAKPFVDTLDAIINKMADAYEAGLRDSNDGSGVANGPVVGIEPPATSYNPASPPDLTYTKLLSATLNGVIVAKRVNWNGLLKQMITRKK